MDDNLEEYEKLHISVQNNGFCSAEWYLIINETVFLQIKN